MSVLSLVILCAAALVFWVYQHDRYEKEPWHAILIALATGFGGMWLIGLADDWALRYFSLSREQIFARAALIAAIEEGGKLVALILLSNLLLRRHFNDPMDGLIYGRLVGLAMGVEESLLYQSLAPDTLHTLATEIVRLFAHSLMGGLVGFAVGLGAHPVRGRRRMPGLVMACLFTSMLLHFGWNVIAYAGPSDDLLSRLIPMATMLTLMALWKWLCSIAEDRSREIFRPAVAVATA